jgi:predicted Rossmann fold nucleotide-binding protein DprA/Smf involved in DNA uptake
MNRPSISHPPAGLIAITGTRVPDESAELDAQFDRFLSPFDTSRCRWLLGGAAGIDTSALHWLIDHGCGEIVITVPVTVNEQPEPAVAAINRARATSRLQQLVELCHPDGVGAAAFSTRNRWLVEHSDLVIGFPVSAMEDGSGTWETLNYARSLERPTIVVPVGTSPPAHRSN